MPFGVIDIARPGAETFRPKFHCVTATLQPPHKRARRVLIRLDRVVLRGHVHLTTSVLGAIADAGAGVLMLSGRNSRHLATFVGKPHNDVVRRLEQFDAYRDPAARKAWSQTLILAKTQAQTRLLQRALDRRPDKRRVLVRTIRQFRATANRLSEGPTSTSIATLLGVEGAAAAAYFSGYCELFPPSVEFGVAIVDHPATLSTPAFRWPTRCCISRRSRGVWMPNPPTHRID